MATTSKTTSKTKAERKAERKAELIAEIKRDRELAEMARKSWEEIFGDR